MKETREDRFRRMAEARVNKLLHMMRLVILFLGIFICILLIIKMDGAVSYSV